MFSDEQKKSLLLLARFSIINKLTGASYTIPDDPDFQVKRGLFVSLHLEGQLRGCIGYIQAYKNIVSCVQEMAVSAAFKDPRFEPVTLDELNDLVIEISILSEMRQIHDTDSIVIGRDGLYLDHPYGSGLLLPQVPVEWEWDLHDYLKHICLKAGLKSGSHKDSEAVLYRFTAEVFSEADKNPA